VETHLHHAATVAADEYLNLVQRPRSRAEEIPLASQFELSLIAMRFDGIEQRVDILQVFRLEIAALASLVSPPFLKVAKHLRFLPGHVGREVFLAHAIDREPLDGTAFKVPVSVADAEERQLCSEIAKVQKAVQLREGEREHPQRVADPGMSFGTERLADPGGQDFPLPVIEPSDLASREERAQPALCSFPDAQRLATFEQPQSEFVKMILPMWSPASIR
jgi:hypothetical protein